MLRDRSISRYRRPPSKIGDQPQPWLLISHGKNVQKLVLYDLAENRFHNDIADPMPGNMVYPTNFSEWFVIEDKSLECRLWNMTTLDTFKLPDLQDEVNGIHHAQFILDRPPGNGYDSHVAVLRHRTQLWFGKLGEDTNYRAIDVNIDLGDSLTVLVIFQGSVLLMTTYGTLFKVQLGTTTACTRLTWDKSIKDMEFRTSAYEVYLIESGDELFCALRLRTGHLPKASGFLVFRINLSEGERKWVRVKDIGDKAFFISAPGRALCWTPNIPKLKRNCIYYVVPSDTNIYMYDLEDESVSSWHLCSILGHSFSHCDWII